MPGDRKKRSSASSALSALLRTPACLSPSLSLCAGRCASLVRFANARFPLPVQGPAFALCASSVAPAESVCCKHSSTQTQNSCCIIATFTIAQHGHRVCRCPLPEDIGVGKALPAVQSRRHIRSIFNSESNTTPASAKKLLPVLRSLFLALMCALSPQDHQRES